jgi:hypothetical protein
MKLSQQHPVNIVARCLLLEQIRTIKPEDIHKVAPEFVYEYENEEGKSFYDVDWEFALFEATMFQLQKLFDNFVSQKERKSNTKRKNIGQEIINETIEKENEVTEQSTD